MTAVDYSFRAMGSDVRLLIGPALRPGAPTPVEAARREHAYVEDFSRRLSRFRPDSELSILNRDPRTIAPASPLLRAAVTAGVWAAQRTGGLVEPTLVEALERAGYDQSLDGVSPISLREALLEAPERRPARVDPRARWQAITLDDRAGRITRPPGLRLDTGGTGKGLCADVVAHRLQDYTRFLVDCSGDIAVGGVGAQLEPYEIEVEHPLTGRPIGSVRIGRGGIATSGVNVRIWRDATGQVAHHLLDPSTGRPAWTGLIAVTAVGASALEAETLSKMALLLGPDGAREVLLAQGGVMVHDSGEVEAVGPLARTITHSPAPVLSAS